MNSYLLTLNSSPPFQLQLLQRSARSWEWFSDWEALTASLAGLSPVITLWLSPPPQGGYKSGYWSTRHISVSGSQAHLLPVLLPQLQAFCFYTLLFYWVCASQCASGTLEHPLIQEGFFPLLQACKINCELFCLFSGELGLLWVGLAKYCCRKSEDGILVLGTAVCAR